VRDAFAKHLSGLFNVSVVVIESDDHDSLRTGEPVDAIEINDSFHVYGVPGTRLRKTITGTREEPFTKWAVDKLIDDSDPSVGMFGWEPVEHSIHDTLYEAMGEVAAELARLDIQLRLEAEAEAEAYAQQEEWDNQMMGTM